MITASNSQILISSAGIGVSITPASSCGAMVIMGSPQGLPGPSGPSGETSTVQGVNQAGFTIQAGQAVRLVDGGFVLALGDDRADSAIGICNAATGAGQVSTITIQGPLTLSDWTTATGGSPTLTPGSSYFLSGTAPGVLTLVPPGLPPGAICQFLGRAYSPTSLLVQIERPIIL